MAFIKLNSEPKIKIVGLIQVRNEEFFIEQCLKALACYTDAIVVIDDASTDNTVNIIKSLAEETKVEKLILHKESSWQTKDERYNLQELLDTGRAIGGTHFIWMDADEMFSSNCLKNNCLKNRILEMKKGQLMRICVLNLWDGMEKYRIGEHFDIKTTFWGKKPVVLCDDGACNYDANEPYSMSKIIHISREPENRKTDVNVPRDIFWNKIKNELIHFHCVNLDRIYDKRIWYMCLELIRANEKSEKNQYKNNAMNINKYYSKQAHLDSFPKNKNLVTVSKSPSEWFSLYNFFNGNVYKKYNPIFRNDVLKWFKKYGVDYFKALDIWFLNWTKEARAKLRF